MQQHYHKGGIVVIDNVVYIIYNPNGYHSLKQAHKPISLCGNLGEKGKMIRVTTTHIEGSVDELFEYGLSIERPRASEVKRVLAGVENIEFRVPAADTGMELFFNNRELLCRFTSLCKPDQQAFLRAIRDALKRGGVDTIRLTVDWSSKSKRTINIRKINHEGALNIYL